MMISVGCILQWCCDHKSNHRLHDFGIISGRGILQL